MERCQDPSHDLFSRISHEKVCAVPPGGGLTMTSYPVDNKTLLSWKACLAAKTLLWITYHEVMIAIPESVMKRCVLRPG